MAKKKPQRASSDALIAALGGVQPRPLVAVSGGCDSMSLVDACVRAGLEPVAAHFNHRWSPAENAWERFVREWCRTRGVRCVVGRARRAGPTSETQAREERYSFLLPAVRRVGASCLLTAHHADDQAETLLMRLLRGTGVSGLAGIASSSLRDGVRILRPWLCFTREEIRDYARRHRVNFVEDPFNAHEAALRVQVRQRVLPIMDLLAMPGLARRLATLAEKFREDFDFLDTLGVQALARVRDKSRPELLHIGALDKEPPALRRRAVALWLRGITARSVPSETLEQILRMALSKSRCASVNLPGDYRVRRRAGRLLVEAVASGKSPGAEPHGHAADDGPDDGSAD